MPVPKDKQQMYSKIVGRLTNIYKRKGLSPGAANHKAKKKADKAIRER